MAPEKSVAEQLLRAIASLFEAGVMQHSGHGNGSVRLGDQRMLLTRSGNLRHVSEADVSTVDLDGDPNGQGLDPHTAEIVEMHAAIYRERDAVGAILHNHAPHATSFAVAGQPLPCVYEPLLRFGAAVIPVADWAPRGSPESVRNIAGAISEQPAAPAVLLANHGLLAFGESPAQAARVLMLVEEAATVVLRARLMGGERSLPEEALAWERERMARFGASPR